MFENRDLRQDLFALGLLALVVFLGLALATYDPADPVREIASELGGWYPADVLVSPQNARVQNACGRWGALVADILLRALGLGAWYLLGSLAVVNFALLRRQQIDGALTRAVGWLASLVGFSILLATLVPQLSPGPVIGSAGYLGALCGGLVQMHFALAGGLILGASLVVGGLLLCTDYWLLLLAMRLSAVAAHGMGGRSVRPRRSRDKSRPLAASGIGQARNKNSDKDQVQDQDKSKGRKQEGNSENSQTDKESDASEEDLSVRIRGRRIKQSDAVKVELNSEQQDDDEEDVAAVVDEDAEKTEHERAESAGETDDELEEALEDEEAESEEEEATEQPEPVAAGKKPRNGKSKGQTKEPAKSLLKVRNPAQRSEREQVIETLDAATHPEDAEAYQLPGLDLLISSDEVSYDAQAKEVRRKAKILEKTFADFGFQVKVVEIETGPVIAQYEVQLEAGLRLSKITGLADDLAIALRVPSVRIVAPIPGKNTVGIEVPNDTRQVVRLREVIEESDGKTKKMRIPLFLGKDVSGNALTVDLSTLPHLLIAGRTGTGKSVCLNAIINSILMTRRPDEVRLLMIDPKMVELSGYARLPHLMHPVVTDMRKAEAILAWAVEKMEERYALLARAGVRHISSYNQLSEEELIDRLEPEDDEQRKAIPLHLPFIVIVADEMADLMMTAGKEVEQHIIRLAQKSRAVGIHLILATQKPTVDVITGLIKSNLPARIAFQVASRTDSRVVLDEMGADKLLGNGDMLFLWPGTSTLVRGQGTYVSDDEINAICAAVGKHEQNFVNELVNIKVEDPQAEAELGQLRKRDELYETAIDIVVREGRGSVSLLQRTLGIGYGRAARLIDFMAEDKIVGEYNGSQAREVVISIADWEAMQGQADGATNESPAAATPSAAATTAPPPKRRTNKVLPESDGDADDDVDVSDESEDEVEDDAEDDAEVDDEADFEDEEEVEDSADAFDEQPEEEWDEQEEIEDDEATDEEEEEEEEEYVEDAEEEEDAVDELDEDADDEELDEEEEDQEEPPVRRRGSRSGFKAESA